LKELQQYDLELIDDDVYQAIIQFRNKYNLTYSHSSFEKLNSETGDLLLWIFLKQAQRELSD